MRKKHFDITLEFSSPSEALVKPHSVCLASLNEQFIIISKLKDIYISTDKNKKQKCREKE